MVGRPGVVTPNSAPTVVRFNPPAPARLPKRFFLAITFFLTETVFRICVAARGEIRITAGLITTAVASILSNRKRIKILPTITKSV